MLNAITIKHPTQTNNKLNLYYYGSRSLAVLKITDRYQASYLLLYLFIYLFSKSYTKYTQL